MNPIAAFLLTAATLLSQSTPAQQTLTVEVTDSKGRRYIAGLQNRSMPPPTQSNPNWRDTYHPITRVNWMDAADYCKWAGGRLPTEAE